MERLKRFAKYLPLNPVIIEAGANDGEDTLKMVQTWPQAKIYAFEPYPKIYEKLKQQTADYPTISPHCIALGDRCGMIDFYISRDPEYFDSVEDDRGCSSSILPPSQTIWHQTTTFFEQKIQVPITILDKFANEMGIEHVDFMWLDMQGSEGLMLQASPKILRTATVIQTEYADKPYYEGTIVFDDLTVFLEAEGFHLLYREGGSCGDAVYVNFQNLRRYH